MNIGILGGGQLGAMLIDAGKKRGHRFHVFEPGTAEPCLLAGCEHHRFDYSDREALTDFAAVCDAITCEFENVPSEAMKLLASLKPVHPSPGVFAVCQNRYEEKSFASRCKVPAAPFARVHDSEGAKRFMKLNGKMLLKSISGGYDGKGQALCESSADLDAFFEGGAGGDFLAEKWVSFEMEISVIVARNTAGEKVFFPIPRNLHRHGVLAYSFAPGAEGGVCEKARGYAALLADELDLVGLLAVEMFALPGGEILINEMAPRPHNSGHFTMDACDVSQFDQLISVLESDRLLRPRLTSKVAMVNALGTDVAPSETEPRASGSCTVRGYRYGKSTVKPGRKMGHFNVLGASFEEIEACIEKEGLSAKPLNTQSPDPSP